jgi:hypothetical protein
VMETMEQACLFFARTGDAIDGSDSEDILMLGIAFLELSSEKMPDIYRQLLDARAPHMKSLDLAFQMEPDEKESISVFSLVFNNFSSSFPEEVFMMASIIAMRVSPNRITDLTGMYREIAGVIREFLTTVDIEAMRGFLQPFLDWDDVPAFREPEAEAIEDMKVVIARNWGCTDITHDFAGMNVGERYDLYCSTLMILLRDAVFKLPK